MVKTVEISDLKGFIDQVVTDLCRDDESLGLTYKNPVGLPMPSVDALHEFVEMVRAVLFPGYFGDPDMGTSFKHYHVGTLLDRIIRVLSEQISRGMCFEQGDLVENGDNRAMSVARKFVGKLPAIRGLLSTDVRAAYEGDPAAQSPGEAIFCYPSIKALTNHRIAHALHTEGCNLIPRIISEMAHSETGIDIHPGATIDRALFIDHGTGVVIGETCRIGKNVRIYQGVTLGAKSFPLDDDGNPIKGIPRHPVVGNNVIIYSGATILGRITIGDNAVIGGNVWVTSPVPAGARVLQSIPGKQRFEHGAGI